jgi:hypothetical protein
MCLTASMPAPVDCNISGGILRVLVAKAEDILLSDNAAPSFTIPNTGLTRYQVDDIDAALNWYELKFDRASDASADAENTVAGAAAYTHTVTVRTKTTDADTQRALIDLQNCCGYIALVKYATGVWALFGLNYSTKDGSYDSADMKVKNDFTSGANRADAAAGGTLAVSSPNVNFSWIPVAPAAIAGITIV